MFAINFIFSKALRAGVSRSDLISPSLFSVVSYQRRVYNRQRGTMPEKLTLSVSELITQLWVILYFHWNEMTMKGKAVV